MGWWQVAAGDGGRNYSRLFFEYGVFCIGPGRHGPYRENRDAYGDERTVKRFAEEVVPGHRLALKVPAGAGRWQVLAVGEVVGDYSYEPAFEDVEGWDLQHARRVVWYRVNEEPIAGLTRGMLKRAGNASALLDDMWERAEGALPIKEIPEPGRKLEARDLAQAFFDHGLSIGRSEGVAVTIERLSRLAEWYDQQWGAVSENEIRTFLVVPLLVALGWPEQRMKIEWERVDVALFDKPFTRDAKATLLVESKRLGAGLRGAADQARRYAADHPSLRSLIVTDGFRYVLYEPGADDWDEAAYANLTRLRDEAPTMGLPGADTLFLKLLPETAPLDGEG